MKLQDIFIGRPVYWALIVAITAVLAGLGISKQHVRDFVPFHFMILGLAIFAVAAIVMIYKPGERITREPLKDE